MKARNEEVASLRAELWERSCRDDEVGATNNKEVERLRREIESLRVQCAGADASCGELLSSLDPVGAPCVGAGARCGELDRGTIWLQGGQGEDKVGSCDDHDMDARVKVLSGWLGCEQENVLFGPLSKGGGTERVGVEELVSGGVGARKVERGEGLVEGRVLAVERAAWDEERDKFETERGAWARQRASLESVAEEAMRERGLLEEARLEAESRHAKRIAEVEAEHRAMMDRVESRCEARIAEVEAEHRAMMEEAESKHGCMMNETRGEVARAKRELEEAESNNAGDLGMRRGVGMQAWEEETEALLRVGNRALEVTIRDLEKERGLLMEECQRLKDQVHELEFNLVQFESVVSEQLDREREWKRERGGMAEEISGLQAELVGIRNAVVEEIERGREEREEVESVREALRAECEKEKKRAESEAWARGEAARLEQELAR